MKCNLCVRWLLRCVSMLLLMASLLSGCSRQPVVAMVDGEDITADELMAEARLRNIPQESRALQQLLDVIIDRNAAAVKAKDMNLDEDPDFQRAYRNLALETLKNRYRLDWEQELTVSESEIQAEYEQNPTRYTVPEKIRVALIVFEAGPQGDSASVAQQAFTQLQATSKGEPRDRLFQTLAVTHSLDRASRYRGGDVGMLVQGETSQWPDQVQAAAFKLQEAGDVSSLIDADGKHYLIKLENRQPAHREPLADVKDSIHQRLLTARFDGLRQRTQNKLREDIAIKVYPKALAALDEREQGDTAPVPEPPPGPDLN